MNGVVEKLSANTYLGWIGIEQTIDPNEVAVEAIRAGRVLARGKLGGIRADVRQNGRSAYEFKISVPISDWCDSSLSRNEIEIYATHGSCRSIIELWRPIKLAQEIAGLSHGAKKALRMQLDRESRETLEAGALAFIPERRIQQRFDRCCVVTYANDSAGWFPYFFNHYANNQGLPDIYVVTPQPSRFNGFDLAGVIGIKEAKYDDAAICNILSNVANGLRSYFGSVIVCDVDEILEPEAASPHSTLRDYICSTEIDIMASRGVDVVQLPEEGRFDFSKTVLENRSCGILNTAMYKPHFSRIPVRYGEGQHFCSLNARVPFLGDGLVSYHLKWACSYVRREIQAIVAGVVYEEEHIGRYSVASVSTLRHPLLADGIPSILGWRDGRIMDFEKSFADDISYVSERGVWSQCTELKPCHPL